MQLVYRLLERKGGGGLQKTAEAVNSAFATQRIIANFPKNDLLSGGCSLMGLVLELTENFFYPLPVYGVLLVIYFYSCRLLPLINKTNLFVWFFSVPLTIFIFVYWIEQWPPIPLTQYGLLVYGFLLAQFGWVGALLSICGIVFCSRKLHSAAFVISVVSTSGHFVFFTAVIFSGKFS